eukprot:CCRYP_009768-RA/>CCRYP_009768-RA protein AED:0.35 eAED:0.24 QI:0/0/0/1/0/0/3/0/398
MPLDQHRVYWWRLLLEEYGPKIVYIKGIHNTVADAISRLDSGPTQDDNANWMTFTKCWCHYTEHAISARSTQDHQEDINLVFANCNDEDVIYPLIVKEIAQAQTTDATLKNLSKHDKYSTQLLEDTRLLCKDGKMVIPKVLQNRAVSWKHHYLQHPRHTRLEEMLHIAIYWKGMRRTIRSHVKNCCICLVNKRHKHKYGKLPTKLVITNPWEALCVDLIGPYSLKGKDGTEIGVMCLTMIDPASSWFEIVELPVTTYAVTPMKKRGKRALRLITLLINKTWFSRYPHRRCQYIIYDNGSKFKLHFKALCESYGIKRLPTSVKNLQANAILERVHQVITAMLCTTELDMANHCKRKTPVAFRYTRKTSECTGRLPEFQECTGGLPVFPLLFKPQIHLSR